MPVTMQKVVITARGEVMQGLFTDEEDQDPVAEEIAAILTNPVICRPVKLMAIFDDGETITWSLG